MVVQPAFISPWKPAALRAVWMTAFQKGATSLDQSVLRICSKPEAAASNQKQTRRVVGFKHGLRDHLHVHSGCTFERSVALFKDNASQILRKKARPNGHTTQ